MWYILIVLIISNLSAEKQTRFPKVSGETFDGETINLSDIKNAKAIVVSFWASWCKPCVKELKKIDEFYRNYRDSGLVVVAINEDAIRTKQKAEQMVKSNKYSFLVLHDKDGYIKRTSGVIELPTTFLLDSELNVIYKRIGYKPGDEVILLDKIKKILYQCEE